MITFIKKFIYVTFVPLADIGSFSGIADSSLDCVVSSLISFCTGVHAGIKKRQMDPKVRGQINELKHG